MNRNNSFRKAYKQQKNNARRRNVQWCFTYVGWCMFWIHSGYWNKRGKQCGQYQMTRFNDKGPYAPWNVKIVTIEKNISSANLGKALSPEHRAKISKARLGFKCSLETRLKMSESFKARTGTKNPFYGKKHSSESKRKMSKIHMGNKYRLGKKHTPETKAKISAAMRRRSQ